MTGIDSYSITPATNATADGGAINLAEGMPPSAVNNTGRQALADIRSRFNDLIYFQYGTGDQGAGNLAVPAVYSSGTVFTIAGADVTAAYHVYRRVRAVGASTGTIYGTISVTSYAPTTTTVTVVWDSGSLANETLVISLCQVPFTGVPIPSGAISGTKTNNAAAAGTVGEEIEASVASGAAVSLTTATPANVTSISLTAGDWDVTAQIGFIGAVGTTISYFIGSISSTSATLNANRSDQVFNALAVYGIIGSVNFAVYPVKFTIASTTTVYLVAQSAFGVSTNGAFGTIRARRIR